jgi:TfoX/Sxy family transcriptional regulator of competence genes
MQVPKASDDAKTMFAKVVPDDPRVVVKPMFGNLGAFVNGNMFAGLFGDRIGVRLLDESVRAEFEAVEGAGPFGPEERPMRGYVAAPAEWADEPERLREWVGSAFAQVVDLPPKAPKPPKAKVPRTAKREVR